MSALMTAALKLDQVCCSFGSYKAVTDVSLTFDAGEQVCIIGPNGAGKSTLLNMMCGTLPLSSGRITLGGLSLDGLSRDRIAKLGIARKFQVPTVFESLSVADNLRVAAGKAGDTAWLAEVLPMVNLAADAGVSAGTLPHGKKQWLEIGMALAMRPRILLLDEPTAGLSVDETLATANLLKGLAGRVTVIVIEHDMGFVRELGARTVVLHHGQIIASGPFSAIEQDDTVRDIYLGRR
jgi:ABC-type uncharacterized transport system ATPase subunit